MGWLWLWSGLSQLNITLQLSLKTPPVFPAGLCPPLLAPRTQTPGFPFAECECSGIHFSQNNMFSWTTDSTHAVLDPKKHHSDPRKHHSHTYFPITSPWCVLLAPDRADTQLEARQRWKWHKILGGSSAVPPQPSAASSGMAQNTQRTAEQPGMELPVRGEGCKCN